MAKHAFVTDQATLTAQGDGTTSLTCTAIFWEEDGTDITFSSDPTSVEVAITALMVTGALIQAAIFDAVKDKANELYSWSLGVNSVISYSSASRG